MAGVDDTDFNAAAEENVRNNTDGEGLFAGFEDGREGTEGELPVAANPVDDILLWSKTKLSPWRQDALRRLACNSVLAESDQDHLFDLIKKAAGFDLAAEPPIPVPLDKTHFASVTAGSALTLKAIRNVQNVNRLVPAASIPFAPKGLTVIYGRNGSGKSGFVRIFRTACRTRIDDPAKLRVLADVYGTASGPQEAELVIETDKGEIVIPWKTGSSASELLLQVAVFDSSAAQLYVDAGNQIQFLPFGLALPHKLNELCLAMQTRLGKERVPVADQLNLSVLTFEAPRASKAQTFYDKLSAKTTDGEIEVACAFSKQDEERLLELTQVLASKGATEIDLRALSKWATALGTESDTLDKGLNDSKLAGFLSLQGKAKEARTSASLDADSLFSGEPLPGVGHDTWRVLWQAAKDYSAADAFIGREFPVVSEGTDEANCLLCQQPLSPEASERLKRFHSFVDGALATAAAVAEQALIDATAALPKIDVLAAKDWLTRVEQIQTRDAALANSLTDFKAMMLERHKRAKTILANGPAIEDTPLSMVVSISAPLEALATKLTTEADTMAAVGDAAKRAELLAEQTELADRKVLSTRKATLAKRRDLLKLDASYAKALAEVQTKGITQRANELVDAHLTKAVTDQFEAECKIFQIDHLKIGLSRKSGQTKASFQTNTGTKLTKSTSDILSEGEQRALALSGFLTEVAVTPGNGPIVIDDPISSLDRERGLKVAARLVTEAGKRQVVVFTHDLIFFNDLCREADERGVSCETIALFSDGANAGKIDPAGVAWKGLPVKKRLGQIRNDFAPLKKLHSTSPSDYEFRIKHLYSRLRETYERFVEECIFCDVIRRGVDRVETQKLRFVHLSDALAIRFHDGMTKANTYSHDNPAAATVAVPTPMEFEDDLAYFEKLMNDLAAESAAVEGKRPSMKPKKA